MNDQNLINSLLVQLQRVEQFHFNEVLEKLLGFPDVLGQVVKITEDRHEKGVYITDDNLVSVISKSGNQAFYQKERGQLFKNNLKLLDLYKAKFPDPEIEKTLIGILYEIRFKDDSHLRRPITEAMGDVGTEGVLPTLKAISYELEPSVKVRRAFPDALDIVEKFEAKSRIVYFKCLELTIEKITDRLSAQPENSSFGGSGLGGSDDNLPEEGLKSERTGSFEGHVPDVAAMRIRRAAEELARDSYHRLGLAMNGKPAGRMKLEELINALRENGAPRMFIILLQACQNIGNFAVHPQAEQAAHLNAEIAAALSVLYRQAKLLHSEWFKLK